MHVLTTEHLFRHAIALCDGSICLVVYISFFNSLAGIWLVSGIFGKKTLKRTWFCVGISPVRYALQTR